MDWKNKIDQDRLPEHIAVIMDGNGRWAERKKRPRTFGHQAGLKTLRKVVEHCGNIGVQELTRRANELAVTEYRPLELYSFLILEYLALVLVISAGVRWLERRMGSDERR